MYLQGIINSRIFQIITVFIMAVVLLLAINSGIKNGQAKAETEAVMANAENLIQVFEYFYKDQGRYPTALEYSEPETMAWYMSKFPVPDVVSVNCQNSFKYTRPNSQKYELNFCLAENFGNFKSGWNKYASSR